MKKALSLILALVMLVSLVACGKTESTEAAVEEAEEPLKVALCVTGLVNDGNWCQIAYQGLLDAQEELNCEIAYAENCQVSDMEAIFTDYASQGFDLVIGHGFQFGDPAIAVGEKYPDTKFVVIQGGVGSENVASYNIATEEASYVIGALAAKVTTTGKLGTVMAQESPAIIKCAEAFKLGAKSVNPDIVVKSAYTGSWDDASLAKEAAQAQIDEGCDVIYAVCNAAGNGAVKACEENGVYCIGDEDMNALAPDTVITGLICNYTGLLAGACKDVANGTFEGGYRTIKWAENPDIASLAPYYGFEDKLDDETKQMVEDLIAQIKNGELEIPVIETATED